MWSDTGAPLGRVERVLVDVGRRRVTALTARSSGLTRRVRVVPLSYVTAWSGDGPRLATRKLPSRRDADRELSEGATLLADPIGLPVVLEGGRALGRVCDVRFSGADGTVETVEVSRGIVGDLASGSVTLPVGSIIEWSADGLVVEAGRDAALTAGERLAGAVGRHGARAALKAKGVAKRALDRLERLDG